MYFDNFIKQLLNGTDFILSSITNDAINKQMYKCYTAKKQLANGDELTLRIVLDPASTIFDGLCFLSSTNICLFGDIICKDTIDKTVFYYRTNTINRHNINSLTQSLCDFYDSDAWRSNYDDDYYHSNQYNSNYYDDEWHHGY